MGGGGAMGGVIRGQPNFKWFLPNRHFLTPSHTGYVVLQFIFNKVRGEGEKGPPRKLLPPLTFEILLLSVHIT
mgnify:FL=1